MPPRLVLVVGAPRSGTTWLQELLGQHPSIATPQETDLFSHYLAPLDRRWRQQLERGVSGSRWKGLPAVLTAEQFADAMRGIVDATLDAVSAMKPGATVVVEKSPSHALVVPLIEQYVPEARFVHLVRDGRDVAASLVAASRSWGRGWAPRNLEDAARLWERSVRGAATAARCHEVRYEQLRREGPSVLQGVFDACGVDVTLDEATGYLTRADLGARRQAGTRAPSILVGGEFADRGDEVEPVGFFGQGRQGGWREWSGSERRAFDRGAGQLLIELGYEPDRGWVGRRPFWPSTSRVRRFVALSLRHAASRSADVIDPA